MENMHVRKLNTDIRCSIHNKFDFEVVDSRTGEITERAQAYNVVCDTFWSTLMERMAGRISEGIFSQLVLGDGTGTPSASDTTLFHKLKNYNNWSSFTEAKYVDGVCLDYSTPGVVSAKRLIIIQANDLVDADIREVGLSRDGTTIVTHALIQDMNGNPIVIHKTEHDILNIYPTVYLHFNVNGYDSGNIYLTSPPNDVSWMGEGQNLITTILGWSPFGGNNSHSWFYWLYDLNGNVPANVGQKSDSTAVRSVDVATRTISLKIIRADQTRANYPIPYMSFEVTDGKRIPDLILLPEMFSSSQLSVTGESVGTGDGSTQNFVTKFPVKSNLKLYLNGTLQDSGYTILYGAGKVDTSATNLVVSSRFTTTYHGRRVWLRKSRTEDSLVYPPQSDYVIYNNPNQYKFNYIYYRFSTYQVSYGVTVYIEVSSDGETWTTLTTMVPTRDGNREYTYTSNSQLDSKYIRFRWDVQNPPEYPSTFTDYPYIRLNYARFYNDVYGACNIHFDTPPAVGTVITVDYLPDCIPKDENHVLDLGLTFQFGDYNGGA